MKKTYLPSEMADQIRNGYRNNLDVLGFGNKPGNMIYDLAPNPGITDPIHYEKIAEAINELLSGVDYRNYDIFAEREITENGEYVAFDDDTYGYSRVVVDVPQMVVAYTYDEEDEGKVISNGEFVTQEPLTINQNGVYDTTTNNTVTVNVEGSSGLEEIFEIDAFIDRTISSIANQRISSIGNYAFAGCSLLSSISFPKCKTIGSYAFEYCSSLESVFFPECNQIDQYAFEYCSKLLTVSFPKCERIGSYAFVGCSSLLSASFPKCSYIGSITFKNCHHLSSISFPKCEQIGFGAFEYCSSLESVFFPECNQIDQYAFEYCSKLLTVSFPKCERIGSYAFAGCSSLETVFFPECSRIDQYAFSYCSELLSASFPKCSYIGTGAFYYCRNLSQLYLLGSSLCNLIVSTAFNGTSLQLNGKIYVPESLYSSYVHHSQWQYYSSRFFSYISESTDGEDFEASVDNATLFLNGSQVSLSSTTLLIDGSSASITNGQLDL